MKGVSLIICCYNSASRLPETLRYIAHQEVGSDIIWELIIVNNASTDNTVSVAKTEWEKYSCNTPFKIVDQPISGLSSARKKGIETSKHDYILFCDDDNWLDKNYVNIAFETMELHPKAGIIAGQTKGHFEIPKPFWFDSVAQSYVVEKPMPASGYLHSGREYLAGAGMLIRKELINSMQSVGFEPILTGRLGKSLMSGEDYELCLVANYLGFRIYFEEKLNLIHFMSKERLNWDYFIKMTTVGHAIPEVIYDLYRFGYKNSMSQKKKTFLHIYLKLIKTYSKDIVFPLYKVSIKELINFFKNFHLFFRMLPGSILQRKILASRNKLIFLLKNRKLLKKNFYQIQFLFERIINESNR